MLQGEEKVYKSQILRVGFPHPIAEGDCNGIDVIVCILLFLGRRLP